MFILAKLAKKKHTNKQRQVESLYVRSDGTAFCCRNSRTSTSTFIIVASVIPADEELASTLKSPGGWRPMKNYGVGRTLALCCLRLCARWLYIVWCSLSAYFISCEKPFNPSFDSKQKIKGLWWCATESVLCCHPHSWAERLAWIRIDNVYLFLCLQQQLQRDLGRGSELVLGVPISDDETRIKGYLR